MNNIKLIAETRQLSFSYTPKSPFIQNLNLKVPKGSIYGFLGANGAGKSTVIRLLTHLLPSKNQVYVMGEEISCAVPACFSKMGVLIENAALYEHLTGAENLAIVCRYHRLPKSRIGEVLSVVGLGHESAKKVKHYSMGMKQRLGLAIALLPEPELLILDEPVNGLDPKGIREIRELIIQLNHEMGTTVFLSSHLLSEVEKTCTHVGVISNGKLKFQGLIPELQKQRANQKQTLIETSDIQESMKILSHAGLKSTVIDNQFLLTQFNEKRQVSNLITQLVHRNIEVYSVSDQQANLEDWFLELTQE